MGDPGERRAELDRALEVAAAEARSFLAGLDEDPVELPGTEDEVLSIGGELPEEGEGAPAAIAELARLGHATATRSAGPRFFHFVIGGATPGALAADWLTSSFDQNAGAWVGSPLASRLETVCLEWLRDLFQLPREFGGVLVTGGTMANFTCLAVARDWCAERLGARSREAGLAGLRQIPVFSSGYIHASAMKSLALLGIGTNNVHKLARDPAGRMDLGALERRLAALQGAPAIVVANAGEVNAGDFDPIDEMADLATEHGAWLHVDGAFGLFARISPKASHLAAGVERARSVSSDGHKWLNVPHDCGFGFVRDGGRLAATFSEEAAYLPATDESRPSWGSMGPEGSRRARALTIWATLHAYGRSGYRAMVERHLELAQRLATRVDEEPELERLAEVPLNIVCFRWRPLGESHHGLDDLNRRLGEALIRDGRVFAGTTVFEGKVAFRPAIVNWRTRPEDVDALVDVLLELAGRLRG
ncbi:MAG: aspartate aminotransferase family protein [Actinobacteria bacterium]|jgi:glutamate/tyrosine decarboxylase-like PLP-dependent enzyme|nr:MAG: aspartate aminotransferase family protein [Actinomycetota bacterium]